MLLWQFMYWCTIIDNITLRCQWVYWHKFQYQLKWPTNMPPGAANIKTVTVNFHNATSNMNAYNAIMQISTCIMALSIFSSAPSRNTKSANMKTGFAPTLLIWILVEPVVFPEVDLYSFSLQYVQTAVFWIASIAAKMGCCFLCLIVCITYCIVGNRNACTRVLHWMNKYLQLHSP